MVTRFYGFKQFRLETKLLGCVHQRAYVFGKAAATVTSTRINKVVTDARVATNALSHIFNISAQTLGQVRHLIHKTNLGRQHAISRVLCQLCTANTHHQNFVVVAVERLIQLTQEFFSAGAIGANHDAVWSLAIDNGCTFF